jgi:hypothetical protein
VVRVDTHTITANNKLILDTSNQCFYGFAARIPMDTMDELVANCYIVRLAKKILEGVIKG